MCGDHDDPYILDNNAVGSPPHVRGPHKYKENNQTFSGITPACAGTTVYNGLGSAVVWDHPRMCGDHPAEVILMLALGGSPPHVRGPREPTGHYARGRGITPACAGTTNILFAFISL